MKTAGKFAGEIKWSTRQRLQFVEIMAYYTGVVTRSDVANAFGISDAAATKDLKLYQELAKDNLTYKHTFFGFVPSESFSEYFADLSPATALPMIAANLAASAGPYGETPVYGIPTEQLPLPVRFPKKSTLAQIIRAIKQKNKLNAIYHSLTDSDDNRNRIIEPHSLVNTGLRWHVRAYCEDTYDFRDFVLSRFSKANMLDEPAESSPNYDDDWTEIITLELAPHPNLKAQKRQNLLDDYGATGDVIKIKTRRALIGYILNRLLVDTTSDLSMNPNAYQLVVNNRSEIEPFAGWAFL